MRYMSINGRSGKARRVHRVARLSRRQFDEAIDEFMNPDLHELQRFRHVPLVKCTPFFAAGEQIELTTSQEGSEQLNLPFQRPERPQPEPAEYEPTPASDAKHEPAADVPVIRSRPRRPEPRANPTQRPRFNLRRFLVGCMCGMAAGVAAILVLEVLVGR